MQSRRLMAGVICFAYLLGWSIMAQAVPPSGTWTTAALSDHPLVGRIWSVKEQRFIDAEALLREIGKASYVLLGEKHDNADHHRLQAWVIENLAVAADTVVFEMLTETEAPALSSSWHGADTDLDGLGQALLWEERGWFNWPSYRPIFEAMAKTGASPQAGDLARNRARSASRGFDTLGPGVAAALALDQPLEETVRKNLVRHVVDGHCGLLPKAAVGPVINVQRVRDAAMADALLGSSGPGKRGFLIAGSGHTRTDYGVPWYLQARGVAPADITVLSMLEVDEGEDDPRLAFGDVGNEEMFADFIWFTPRVDVQDPCEKYAEQLKAFKKNQKQNDQN